MRREIRNLAMMLGFGAAFFGLIYGLGRLGVSDIPGFGWVIIPVLLGPVVALAVMLEGREWGSRVRLEKSTGAARRDPEQHERDAELQTTPLHGPARQGGKA